MIVGMGTDIVDVRIINNIINKYGKKFKKKCFTKIEIEKSEKRSNSINPYAKRYAAKEALAKALGTGLASGVFWKDISVENNIFGNPSIKLTRNAFDRFNKFFLSSDKGNIISLKLSST